MNNGEIVLAVFSSRKTLKISLKNPGKNLIKLWETYEKILEIDKFRQNLVKSSKFIVKKNLGRLGIIFGKSWENLEKTL
jgi:hypothetical protein